MLLSWTWHANRRLIVGASQAALYAKLVAADERARYWQRESHRLGLADNLKFGVLIRDTWSAAASTTSGP